MLGVFVPTPTVCEVELTVQVEGHITQIIRHNITFHARQREVSVGEYLRMNDLSYQPYSADIRLFSKEASDAIEFGDNQGEIVCDEPIRFEVSRFGSMMTKAFVVITHKETANFDMIAVSFMHPVYYSFREAGTYLIQSVMTGASTACFSYYSIKVAPRPPDVAIYLKDSILEVGIESVLFVTYESSSERTCICVDQGDGRSVVRPPKDHALSVHCCPRNALVFLDNQCSTALTCVPLLYRVAGTYNLTIAVGDSHHFMVVRTMNLTVIERMQSCQPWVRFSDPKLRHPLHPMQLLSSQQYTIHCDVSVASGNCSTTTTITTTSSSSSSSSSSRRYVWHMWLRDANNTSDVQPVIEVDTGTMARLRIKPRSLASGFYHVSLSARDQCPNGGSETVHLDDGYLQIIATPLIIRLLNTSMSRVSISQGSQDLCLRPEVYSIIRTNEGEMQAS
ncbi:hypothetical protein TSMEX_006565 [Taenia solium]|eukprot:TsM_001032900 transcript=TsM_001032900 gene=TsM_001032900